MIATKRKIETSQDRFGGFSRTYNTDMYTSTITGTPSIVEPEYEEVDDDVFEVEKEYKMDDDLTSDVVAKDNNKEVMQTISRERKVNKTSEYANKNTKMKINARGKIILTVFSCIVALLVSFSIYNAVAIGNLNAEVNAKQVAVYEVQSEIDGLSTEIQNMSSENNINSKLDMKFRKVTDNDKVYLEETAKSAVPEYEKTSNFFDKLCEFFSNIF